MGRRSGGVTQSKTTPLHAIHLRQNAKMVPFAGWDMPLYFPGGILAEHKRVRSEAGLFDVSHMGRFRLSGPDALSFTDRVITNRAARLDPDQLLYSCVCNPEGGVLDDVTVYRVDPDVMMVVNAANRERILQWLQEHAASGVTITDESPDVAQIALQGPAAPRIMAHFVGEDTAENLGYYRHTSWTWKGEPVLVSRNGYTGEDGFEMYPSAGSAPALWEALLEKGAEAGLKPVGLGARDTLRLEAAYCLYGHELDLDISPLEAGLGWVVKLAKDEFIGKEALQRQKKEGVPRKLVGLRFSGRALPRHGDRILDGDAEAGRVTSGGISPSLGDPIALGLVKPDAAEIDGELFVEGRRGRIAGRVVPRPFYTGTARVPKSSKKPKRSKASS
ncbi:MAG: glycine cleavage system aminomethyltransferase GcvT [Candidatus Eisenbacteria bacterium]|nr:glycine cleavage system aminomethyltransferase GcvT [Candidatus Eisenbacteria bacterium]